MERGRDDFNTDKKCFGRIMLMQVKVPAGFQSRCGHCAAAFHFTPTLAEVTVFGGTDDARIQADTTVMTLGETVTCRYMQAAVC